MKARSGIAPEYRSAIADETRELEKRLGRGDAKSFEDYLARCAEIRAMKRALDLFESILEKYLSEEEKDELRESLE